MYDHLAGQLVEKQPTRAVVNVGGVGYELTIPLSSFEALPATGRSTTLYCHLHVREDSLRLYGFATGDERRFFRTLLDVSGIGPAVALSILSSARYADFRAAILTDDVPLLTRMKGVGKKTAQRMVLELRDRLEKEGDLPSAGATPASALREDAIAALVTLGFTRQKAQQEVDRILAQSEVAPDIEEVVRLALSHRA